jgi:hypothetical protein
MTPLLLDEQVERVRRCQPRELISVPGKPVTDHQVLPAGWNRCEHVHRIAPLLDGGRTEVSLLDLEVSRACRQAQAPGGSESVGNARDVGAVCE